MSRQSRGFFGRNFSKMVSFGSRRQRRADRAVRRARRSDVKWMAMYQRRQDRISKWRAIFRPFVPINIGAFGGLMRAMVGMIAGMFSLGQQTPSFMAARRGAIGGRKRKSRKGKRVSKAKAASDKDYNTLEPRQLLAGDLYHTSINAGAQDFAVYSTASDTWTTLDPIATRTQLATSSGGDLYMLNENTRRIQIYDRPTDSWSDVPGLAPLPGAGPVDGYGNLEVADNGRFFYSEGFSNQLYYAAPGGGWNFVSLPFQAGSAGDYDSALDLLVIAEYSDQTVVHVDPGSLFMAVQSAGASSGEGEWRRFGEVLDGQWYSAGSSSLNTGVFDLSSPSNPLQGTSTRPSAVSAYPSAAVDHSEGLVYLAPLSSSSTALYSWDPVSDSYSVVNGSIPNSVPNHSTMAFVSVKSLTILGGEDSAYTVGGPAFSNTNNLLANPANFGTGGTVNVAFTIAPTTGTVDAAYLAGGQILANMYAPGLDPAEIVAIDDWVHAGGVLLSTSETTSYDTALNNHFGLTTVAAPGGTAPWTVVDDSHPIFAGPFGALSNGSTFSATGSIGYFTAASLSPGDQVLARDASGNPTIIARSHGSGQILFMSDEGVFRADNNSGALTTPNEILVGNIFAWAASQTSSSVSLANVVPSLPENSQGNKVADIVVGNDPNGNAVLSLSGADAAQFEIVGGALYLRTNADLDFEAQQSYQVTVNVHDPDLCLDSSTDFTLAVTDAREVVQIPATAFAAAALTSASGNGHVTVLKIANMIHVQDEAGNDLVSPHDAANVDGINAVGRNGADDRLTVDVDNLGSSGQDGLVSYEGGTGGNDTLELVDSGATEHPLVTHVFVSESDGSVTVGSSTITYTGLEPVIDNLSATNRVFDFTGAAETITLGAGGGGFSHRIDSTLGELVDFNLPTASLTINAADPADQLIIDNGGIGIVFNTNVANVELNADIGAPPTGTATFVEVTGIAQDGVDVASTTAPATVDVFSPSIGGVSATGAGKEISLRPGGTSQLLLGLDDLFLDANDTLVVDIAGAAGAGLAGGHDLLVVAGVTELNGAALAIAGGFTPAAGSSFKIVDNANASVGTFAGLGEGATVNVGGLPMRITYQGGDGNDIVLYDPALVEFDDLSTSSAEGAVSGGPALFVKGDLTNLSAVQRTITMAVSPLAAVEATIDDVNQGSVSFTIPAGDYSAGQAFDLIAEGVVVVENDNLLEGDEKFKVDIIGFGALTGANADGDGSYNPGTEHDILDDEEGTITITPTTVTEDGGTQTVDVTLTITGTKDPSYTGDFEVAPEANLNVDVVQGTAGSAGALDYTFTSQTVNFGPGTVTGAVETVDFTPTSDDLVEGDETTNLALSNLTDGRNTGDGSNNLNNQVILGGEATITIEDGVDDTATVGFKLSSSSVGEADGTLDVEIELLMTGSATSLGNALSINVNDLLTGTATPGAVDFSAAPAFVTFPAGSVSGATESVTLTIVDDSIVESDETINYSVVSSPTSLPAFDGQVTVGANGTHQITILDDDTATWSLTQAGSPVDENGGVVTYTISLAETISAGETVSVEVSVADLTTMLGVDYGSPVAAINAAVADWNLAGNPGTLTATGGGGASPVVLTFSPGASDAMMVPLDIEVSPINDALVESDESVEVSIAYGVDAQAATTVSNVAINDDDGTVDGTKVVTTTIADDDSATWSVTGSGSVTEGSSHTVTFALTNGGSQSGTDPFLLQAGETASVEIQVVNLLSTSDADYGSPIAALDAAIMDYNSRNGAYASATGTLSRSTLTLPTDPITLTFHAATPGSGWTTTSGPGAGSVGEAASMTSLAVTVLAETDALVEGDEDVRIELANAGGTIANSEIDAGAESATVTIEDANAASWSFTVDSASVNEGDAFNVTLSLSGEIQAGEELEVDFGFSNFAGGPSGDPTEADDFDPLRMTQIQNAIAAYNALYDANTPGYNGKFSRTGTTFTYQQLDDGTVQPLEFALASVDDNLSEGNEDLEANMSSPGSSTGATVTNSSPSPFVMTVIDNDDATWSVSPATDTVVEGDAQVIVFSLSTSLQAGESVSVDIDVVDLDTTGADYGSPIAALDAAITAYNSRSGIYSGATGTLSRSTLTLPTDPITLTFYAAAPGVGWTPTSPVYGAGEDSTLTDLEVSVVATNDAFAEGNEEVEVQLSNPLGTVSVGAIVDDVATITIQDNDVPTWSMTRTPAAIDEFDAAGVDFAFMLSGNVQAGESVAASIQLSNAPATYGADYSLAVSALIAAIGNWNSSFGATQGTLSYDYTTGSPDPFVLIYTGIDNGGSGFSSMSDPLMLNIAPIDDSIVESDEAVEVTLAYDSFAQAQTTVAEVDIDESNDEQVDTDNDVTLLTTTILDDDVATWSLTQDVSEVDEGTGTVNYTFSLDGLIQEGETVTVDIQVVDITTTYGVDYPDAVAAIQDAVDNYAGPGMLTGSFAGGSAPYVLTYTGGTGDTSMADLVVSISPTDDSLVEADEFVEVSLVGAGGTIANVQIDSGNASVVTEIEDDDVATWSLTQSVSSVAEGSGSVTYTFALDGTLEAGETATVDIDVLDVTTALGIDYPSPVAAINAAVLAWNTANPGAGTLSTSFAGGAAPVVLTYTAGAGDTSLTPSLEVTLSPIDDSVVEADEDVTVTISNAGGTIANVAISGTDNSVTTTIEDDDVATWSLTQDTTTVDEGSGSVTYTFALSGTLQAGESATVEIDVVELDTIIGLDYPSPVAAINAAVSAWNTANPGAGTLSTSFAGGSNPVVLTYTAGSGNTSLTPSLTVTLSPIDDALVEGPEDVQVTISNAGGTIANAMISGTDNSVTTTIVDDDSTTWVLTDTNTVSGEVDEGDSATYELGLSGAAVASGDTATIDIGMSLVAPTTMADFAESLADAVQDAVDAYNSTAGTITGADNSFGFDGTTVTYYGDGTSSSPTLSIDLNTFEDDGASQAGHLANLVEPDEDFTISISNPGGSAAPQVTGGPTTLTTTILDDDSATVSLQLVQDASEDPAGPGVTPGVFKFVLSNPSQTSVSVNYTDSGTGGTATAGIDYNALPGTGINFAPGVTEVPLNVVPFEDTLVEGPETVVIKLDGFTNPGLVDPQITIASSPSDQTTVTIEDNDLASLSITSVTVNELTGTVDVTVTLDANVVGGFDVPYTLGDVSDTATGGVDYDNTGGLLSFSGTAGETATITIPINNDSDVEADETLTVKLGTPVPAVVPTSSIDTSATGTVTIVNDDIDLDLGAATPASQAEGDAGMVDYTFEVTRSGVTTGTTTVQYAVTGSGANPATADDFGGSFPSGTVTFAPGQTVQTITVSVSGDSIVEADEDFTVTLSSPTDDAAITDTLEINNASSDATIENDDELSISISGPASVDEGMSAAYTVDIDGQLGAGQSVSFELALTGSGVDPAELADIFDVTFSNLGANGIFASSYDSLTGIATITYTQGGSDGEADDLEVTVTTLDDSLVEGAEELTITVQNVSGSATVGTAAAVTTINDNDDATWSIAQTASTVSETTGSNIAEYTLSLAGNLQGGENASVLLTVDFPTTGPSSAAASLADAINIAITDAGLTGVYTANVLSPTEVEVIYDHGATDGTADDLVFEVEIADDTLVEGDEDYRITLSSPASTSGASVVLGADTVTTTIDDNDVATWSVTGDTSVSEDAGSDVASYQLALDGELQAGESATITLEVTFPGVGGADLADFVSIDPVNLTPGSGTYVIGTVTATTVEVIYTHGASDGVVDPLDFTVTVLDDGLVEGDEDYTIVLTGAASSTGADVAIDGTDNSVTTTITDNDTATLTVTAVSGVNETDAGLPQLQFKVEHTGDDIAGGFTVDLSTVLGGTALAGSDFIANVDTLTFSGTSGEFQIFEVTVIGDEVVELDETVQVEITSVSAPGSISLADTGLGAGVAQGLILNDDSATLMIDSVTLAEGSSTGGTTAYNFVVQLNGEVDTNVVIDAQTIAASATAGSDYVDPGVVTLTFNALGGSTQTQNFVVTINHDTMVEADETFIAELIASSLDAGLRNVTIATGSGTGTIVNDDSSILTISSPTFNESDAGTTTMVFEVTSPNAVAGGFTVPFTLGGDASAADYTVLTSSPLTFSGTAGETVVIEVEITDDTIVEPDETIEITLGSPTALGAGVDDSDIVGGAVGTGTIIDDDSATLTITGGSVAESDTGSTSTQTFTITLTGTVQNAFTVDVASADGTATVTDGDYVANSDTLSFGGANSNSQTFEVTVTGDDKVEADEIVQAILSGLDAMGQDVTIATGTASGVVENDDTATILVSDATADEATGSLSFTISLVGEVDGDVEVFWATEDGTAITTGLSVDGENDYGSATGSVILNSSSLTVETVTISVTDDNVVELAEQFNLKITGVAPVVSGIDPADFDTTDTGVGTITDDDTATVSIAAVQNGAEGGANGQFVVTMSAPSSTDTVVDFVLPGGLPSLVAQNSVDYTVGTVTILAGDTSATLDINVIDDTVVEYTETVTAALTGTDNAAISASGMDTLTIADNDEAEVRIVRLQDGNEQGPINGIFEARLVNPTTGALVTASTDVIVNYDVAGTAEEGGLTPDFTATSGNLTITAGQSTKPVTINVIDDALIEGTETVEVTLTSLGVPVDPQITIDTDGQQTAALDIFDNDGTASVTVATPLVTVNEGDGTATVTLQISDAVAGPFTVSYDLVANTASGEGVDYSSVGVTSGSVTFAGGSATETVDIVIPITDDLLVEGLEDFSVTITGITGAPTGVTASGSATVTIVDNDIATLSVADVTVNEGDGTATVVVSVDNAVDGGFSVDYSTADGTATAGSDYDAASGTLTFAGTAGETVSFTIPLTDDGVIESSETISVLLSGVVASVVPASSVDASGTGEVTILDNDGTATLTVDDVTVNEGDGTATVTVTLDADVQGGFAVDYSTSDGSATEGDDYTESTGTLNFSGTAGESVSFTIPIIDDVTGEPSETINVSLSNVVPGVGGAPASSIDASDTAVVTITDNESPSLTVESVTFDESAGTVTVDVTLNVAVAGGFSVDALIAGVSAIAGDDFTALTPQTLNFAGTAGETQSVTLTLSDDAVVENTETLEISLTSVSGTAISVDTSSVGTVSIDDNDQATLSVQSKVVNEAAGTVTVEVTLDNEVQGGLTVDANLVNGSAVESLDYMGATPQGLTFVGTPGEVQLVTFSINDDALVEATESFSISLSDVVSAGVVNTPSVGTVEIIDNDMATITIADASVSEGDGSVTLSAILDTAVAGGVTADVQITTTDAEGTDYVLGTATVTFAGNVGESQPITINITDDAIVEDIETLTVGLINVSASGSVDASDTADVTINDNDSPATITISSISVDESTGTATVTATIDKAVEGGVTADVVLTDGTADGSDYGIDTTSISFSGVAGESVDIDIAITEDLLIEGSEDLSVSLTNVSGAGTIDVVDGTVTITDNDTATITIDDVTVTEGDGTILVTATLDGQVQGGVTADVVLTDGSAEAGDDYNAITTSISFADVAGPQTVTIAIDIVDDATVEVDEDFTVSLANVVTAGTVDTSDTATVTIQDNGDTATASLSSSVVDGSEAGPVDGQFTVELTAPSATDTELTYAVVGGSADEGTDFTVTGTVVIPAGDVSATIDISVIDDAVLEGTEDVELMLTGQTSGLPVTVDGTTASLDIVDNEAPAEVFFDLVHADRDPNAAEFNNNNGQLIARISSPLSFGLQVGYSISSPGAGQAQNGVDYQSISGQIFFAAGVTEIPIDILVTNDLLVEGDETVTLTLTNILSPTSGDPGFGLVSIIGTPTASASATDVVTIHDNDGPVDAVDDSYTVDQGNTVTGNVLDNDSDPDLVDATDSSLPSDALSVTLVSGPAAGSLTLNSDGTFSYTHNGSAVATDSFTYQVTDSAGNTDTATVTLDINIIGTVTVDELIVNATSWSSTFRDYIDGGFNDGPGAGSDAVGLAEGYRVPTGTTSIPWVGINQVKMVFSEDVGASLDTSDFTITGDFGYLSSGAPGSVPTISAVAWDGTTNTATLSLSGQLDPNKYEITALASGIMTGGGNTLVADQTLSIYVLPGDSVDLHATAGFYLVNGTDSTFVRDNLGGLILDLPGNDPFDGAYGYDARADINGDGFVNGSDTTLIRDRLSSIIFETGSTPLLQAGTNGNGRDAGSAASKSSQAGTSGALNETLGAGAIETGLGQDRSIKSLDSSSKKSASVDRTRAVDNLFEGWDDILDLDI